MNDLSRVAGGVAPELEDLPADQSDQCSERSITFERCSLEADHNPPCRFLHEDAGEWPDDHVPPDPL